MLGLNLPTDVAWERVAHSEDMDDEVVCDFQLPPKWQSSIALYKYEPEEEYQVYPGRKLTYLKLTINLTGYQPKENEIEGILDTWGGLNTSSKSESSIEHLLREYRPCTGALIQATVGAKSEWSPIVESVKEKGYIVYFIEGDPLKPITAHETYQSQNRLLQSLRGSTDDQVPREVEVGEEHERVVLNDSIRVDDGTATVRFQLRDCPDPLTLSLVCYELDAESGTVEGADVFDVVTDRFEWESGRREFELTVDLPEAATETRELAAAEKPYIMDFQPKQRRMYDLVSETGERLSRTLDTVNVRKASGNAQQSEVLDVDKGGSWGANVNVPTGATSAGLGYTESTQGEWGTKSMNQNDWGRIETTDYSTEQRQNYSHTTQLSQAHHLLDSYHVGTNRALFFVLPRPYVKEPPTGFVRGPRPIDGIQEFFLVVNQPEELEELCMSVRLDTAHFEERKEYRRGESSHVIEIPQFTVPIPPEEEQFRTNRTVRVQKNFWDLISEAELIVAAGLLGYAGIAAAGALIAYFRINPNINLDYRVYERVENRPPLTWGPQEGYPGYVINTGDKNGYVIEGFKGEGNPTVSPSADGRSITISCSAKSTAQYYESVANVDEAIWNALQYFFGENKKKNFPQMRASSTGEGYLRVRANLISKTKDELIGRRRELLITTRGLCVCHPGEETVVQPAVPTDSIDITHLREGEAATDSSVPAREVTKTLEEANSDGMTFTEANLIGGEFTREAMARSTARRTSLPTSLLESEYYSAKLLDELTRTPTGRAFLTEPPSETPSRLTDSLAQSLDISPRAISRGMLIAMPSSILADLSNLDQRLINQQKFELLGATVGSEIRREPAVRPESTPPREVEQLTDIGPKRADRLWENDIKTLRDLSVASQEDIASVLEVSETTVDELIAEARTLLEQRRALRERIDGIGTVYAARLHQVGINSLEELADSDPEAIAAIAGVGMTRAKWWIDQAHEVQEDADE